MEWGGRVFIMVEKKNERDERGKWVLGFLN